MNIFERWFLQRIFAKQVRQGFLHSKNIAELYTMIRTACENEFTEDNARTMDVFLQERFQSTQFKKQLPSDK